MKKLILPMMAMLLCMTACKKEENSILTLEAETYSSDAKLHLSTEAYAVWDNGDKVYLNGNTDATTVTVDNTNHKATIESNVANHVNYASYPYRMTPTAPNTYSMTLPTVQTYRENEDHVQIIETPMAALLGSDEVLRFRNLGTLLSLRIYNSTGQVLKINRIEVINTASSNNALSGTATITDLHTENPSMAITSNGKNYVALECNGYPMENNYSKAFYIALPVLTNAKLTVKVYCENSYSYTCQQTTHTTNLARSTYQVVDFATANSTQNYYFRALKGKFQVNASGKKVRFSCGILQCDATASPLSFRFANNQYGGSTIFYPSTMQHFYWGGSDVGYGTNYTTSTYSNATTETDHWGAIADTNTTAGADWQTLTADEWYYLLNTRAGATVYWNGTPVANSRRMMAKVGDHYGLILFPDTNRIDIAINKPVYNSTSGWANVASFTTTEFENQFEAAGCVFLKGRLGTRSKSAITTSDDSQYWTSSVASSTLARVLTFSASSATTGNLSKKIAIPVRLVQVVE